ncbi:hypothetical protein BGX38DRAFT_1196026, partial [Terfezia claveryi]
MGGVGCVYVMFILVSLRGKIFFHFMSCLFFLFELVGCYYSCLAWPLRWMISRVQWRVGASELYEHARSSRDYSMDVMSLILPKD